MPMIAKAANLSQRDFPLMKWLVNLILMLASLGLMGTAAAQEATPESQGGIQVTLDVNLEAGEINVDDVRTTAEIIARRLAGLEIADYRVQIVNGQSIQVQLSPVEDFESTLAAISQTALLELVDFTGLADKMTQFEGLTIATSGHDDEGQANPLTGEDFETVLTGADFQSVAVEAASYDPNQWTIIFELTQDAATIFGDYTEAHVGEPLAIVLDGRVLSTPVIQARLDSAGVITGNFTKREAEQLAAQLRAGALPLPLTVAEVASFETIILEVNNEE
jgi:protein-export membrane protein SecD